MKKIPKIVEFRLEKINLDMIKPYWRNPMETNNVHQVAGSILDHGYTSNILLDEDYTIIAGHSRYKALQFINDTYGDESPYKEIEVKVITNFSPQEKTQYRLIDNKIAHNNRYDPEKLAAELKLLPYSELLLEVFDIKLAPVQGVKLEPVKDLQIANEKQNMIGQKKEEERKETICPNCFHQFFV